jgi:hypothetical protein
MEGGGGSGEDSGDVGNDGCNDGEDKPGAAEIQGIVCSDKRPDVEGKEEGHSVSEERAR